MMMNITITGEVHHKYAHKVKFMLQNSSIMQ